MLKHPDVFKEITTESPRILSICKYIESIAPSQQAVLVTGETGVGKELFARAVHKARGLSGELVVLNVAGLDDNVFSDTLFGHVRGAYTGAEKIRLGLVEKAAGGTLVLDEIGDLSMASQVKLLRLIQDGEYMQLGSDTLKEAYIRIVAVTNKNLWQQQRKGKFREDLNFRLRTHHINIPGLRERKEDIPLLVEKFVERASLSVKKKSPIIPPELFPLLADYNFPGNIRELQSMVFDAVSRTSTDTLSVASFAANIESTRRDSVSLSGHIQPGDPTVSLFAEGFPTLKKATAFLVAQAMKQSGNNITKAANLLGISRQALSKRLQNLSSSS